MTGGNRTGKSFKMICMAMLLLFVAGLLAGCLQSERVVKVKPDGSGTVEETVLFSVALNKMNSDDTSAKSDTQQENEQAEQLDAVNDAGAKAASMGEGVTLVSVTPLRRGDFKGFRTVYAFKDINTLKVSLAGKKTDNKGADKFNFMSFSFTNGDKSILKVKHIKSKSDKPTEDEDKPKEQQNKQKSREAMEMIKAIFKGFQMSEKIMIQDGVILESNATFKSGSLITMMEVDFDKLLNIDPEKLQEIAPLLKGGDQSKARLAMSRIAGFKVDMNDELKIVFRKKGE